MKYKSIYADMDSFQKHSGWSDEEIKYYLKFLEHTDAETLRSILKDAGIGMFSDDEPVDKEQANYVLTNGSDIKKDELFAILDTYISHT